MSITRLGQGLEGAHHFSYGLVGLELQDVGGFGVERNSGSVSRILCAWARRLGREGLIALGLIQLGPDQRRRIAVESGIAGPNPERPRGGGQRPERQRYAIGDAILVEGR